eukprot:TRINITY_DN11692_c0_g1_i1.p2 TRINITY_DN11692_c0_g1~~TRINITY_DN11692_c0_g1_i1.p2  ORF type:complete len:113 (-),score=50.17 TRINITY_DN11692_c0_g1_i1:1293-1631(-)
MQGDLKEIEMKALKIKQDKEEHLQRLEQEKKREEFAEQQKVKQVQEKQKLFKDKLKIILGVILFAGIVGFHVALSLIQREYTGVEASFRHYAEKILEDMYEKVILLLTAIGV